MIYLNKTYLIYFYNKYMDEIPYIIFLHIGQALCNDYDICEEFNEKITIKKPYEYYKNNYKHKLEECITNNKNYLSQLDKEIKDIERKIIETIRKFTNKKFNSNSLNFIYINKPLFKYLSSLNLLEYEKLKYYELTLKQLREQHDIFMKIFIKNITYLDNI